MDQHQRHRCIAHGLRVSVSGQIDGDFIQGRMFTAKTVITLSDNNDQG